MVMNASSDASSLVKDHGHASLSYATLDRRLERFYMEGAEREGGAEGPERLEGFIGYRRSGKTLLALSDPICAPENVPSLLDGFKTFGQDQRKRTAFFAATNRFAKEFTDAGYEGVRVARDAVVNVERFTIRGNRMENVRRGYNHARNVGMEIFEYRPGEGRDQSVEKSCTSISEEWLKEKRRPELEFILGRLDWHAPGDRRFFIARSKRGVEGFMVFHPVSSSGWYMDMSRRRVDAPNGTTDFLLVNSLNAFQEEGARRLYMGMVPNTDFPKELGNAGAATKAALRFLAKRFDRFYPVRSEVFFKKKYRPVWEDLFLYTDSKVTFGLMYDVFKIFQPRGFTGLLMSGRRKK